MKKASKLMCVILCLAVILSAVFSLCVNAVDTGANLLRNPSFETDSGWGFGSLYRTTDKAYEGTYSLKSSARGVTVLVAQGNTLQIKSNTDYLYSCYIYRSDNSAWAYIDMNDATGELQLLNTESYGSWQYVSGVWNSGSATSITPRVVVEPNYTINQHLGAGITGDIWFDNLSLCELSYSDYDEQGTSLGSSAKSYTMKNSDISVTLNTYQNKEYITSLTNLSTNHNWITNAQEIPLTNKYSQGTISWTLKSAVLDTSTPLKGTGENACHSLTLTYSGSLTGLELTSVYLIYPTGPLYHYCEILNNTGKALTFNTQDFIIADTVFTAPAYSTLYRFNRSRYNNGFDGSFTTGVFTDSIGKDAYIKTKTENSWLLSSGELPYQVIDSGAEGLYMGYEWSYGEAVLRTQQNPMVFKLSASLGISNDTVTRNSGESLLIPAVFFGAYSGSVDDGSNQMKSWFYNHLMTSSLRENANEPNIELHLPLYAENDLIGYLYDCNLEEWGVELTKIDYWWTVSSNSAFDAYLEQQWNPDSGKWPSGMTYGKLLKEKYPSVKASLYMADTYQGVDIGTKTGREAQLAALKQRLSDWQIDYWRSDFDLLKPNNYENHEGLMYILDELIAWNEDFRYEHCSAGGSLKDFSTLRRMTFMTMEDSGGALNHRMAFYSNSYMINPVQLKFDLGFDWTSNKDSQYINSNKTEWYTYNVRTAMMGAMMVQNVSNRLNSQELEALQDGWALYKDRQRPILKGADVYHILPMPTGNTLDGIEFYNQELEKGSVFVFRDKSGETGKNIILAGLDENSTYSLTFEDRTHLNCEKTGKELMTTGFALTGMTSVYDSEIIWVEKVSQTTPDTPTETTAPTEPTEQTTNPSVNNTEASIPAEPSKPVSDFSGTSEPNETSASDVPIIIPPAATTDSPIVIPPATATSTHSDTNLNPTTPNSTSGNQEYVLLGDADQNFKISVKDATLIQKYVAKLSTLEQKAVFAADIDANSTVNIKDATNIQKHLANLLLPYPVGVEVLYRV